MSPWLIKLGKTSNLFYEPRAHLQVAEYICIYLCMYMCMQGGAPVFARSRKYEIP